MFNARFIRKQKSFSGQFQPLLTNSGKLIQKLFQNFRFSGHEPVRITGKHTHFFVRNFNFGAMSQIILLEKSSIRIFRGPFQFFCEILGYESDRITGKFIHVFHGFREKFSDSMLYFGSVFQFYGLCYIGYVSGSFP